MTFRIALHSQAKPLSEFSARIRGAVPMAILTLALIFLPGLADSCLAANDEMSDLAAESGWIHMPAGAKSAYMGIQGGTMPISLLVANDGSALLSFVGKTGNDFLATLARGNSSMPSFGNGAFPGKLDTKTGLFAGNATASLPVFTTNGLAGEWLSHLAPFGFSVSPLPIEGQPDIPPATPRVRKYKTFYLPGSLKTPNNP